MRIGIFVFIGLCAVLGAAAQTEPPNTSVLSSAANQQPYDALQARISLLEERRIEEALAQVERNADWVIGLTHIVLSIFAGITVIFLAVAGFLKWNANDFKNKMMEDFKDIKKKVAEVEEQLERAKTSADKTERHERKAEEHARRMDLIEKTPSAIGKKLDSETRKAAEAVANDKTADPIDRQKALARKSASTGDWDQALALWKAIAAVQEENVKAILGIAFCSGQLADKESNPQKKRALREEECQKYAEAVNRDDTDPAIWSNWGVALGRLAALVETPEEKKALIEEACQKYAEAVKRDDTLAGAWHNWGNALGKVADLAETAEQKQALCEAACQKYEEAVKRDDALVAAWSNWGNALEKIGDFAETSELKRALRDEACQKYTEAVKRDDTCAVAWANWGGALLHLSNLEGDEAKKKTLLQEANENCLRAEELEPGLSCYNFACIAAVQGDQEACKSWLKKAEALRCLPSADHLMEDTDLESVRKTKWFKDLVSRQRTREQDQKSSSQIGDWS